MPSGLLSDLGAGRPAENNVRTGFALLLVQLGRACSVGGGYADADVRIDDENMYRPHAMKNAPLPCAITSSQVGPVSLVCASR
jgi:hypothetical protein